MALLLAAGLAACMEAPGTNRVDGTYAARVGPAASPVMSRDVGEVTYRAVDRLVDGGGYRLGQAQTIAVGAFTNQQAHGGSDAFGGFVADLVRTRLVQRGLIVTDLHAPGLHAPSLVRVDRRAARRGRAPSRRVAYARGAGSEIVTGTYVNGQGLTFVSMKVVSPYNARILAAVDFAVPRTR